MTSTYHNHQNDDDVDRDLDVDFYEGRTLVHLSDPEDVISTLAQDLYNLSVQEREAVYDDIHGTAGLGEPAATTATSSAASKDPISKTASAIAANLKSSSSSSLKPMQQSSDEDDDGNDEKRPLATAGYDAATRWGSEIGVVATARSRGGSSSPAHYSSSSSPPSSPSGRPMSPSRGSGEDDPIMVEGKLKEFELHINSIEPKEAYDMALRVDPDYVQSRGLRLMFLRSKRFDVKDAGKCMLKFFAGKLDLFGPGTLTRSLRWTDLDKHDREYIQKGYMQVLPSRDSAGRVVVADMHLISNVQYKTPRSAARGIAYFLLSVLENDEVAQKQGLVMIGYAVNSSLADVDPGMHAAGTLIMDMIPVRFACWHVCIGAETWFRRLQANMVRILRHYDRIRVRCHEGSKTEIMYSLLSYGIPMHDFPVSDNGIVLTSEHAKWLMMQQRKEEVYDLIRPIQPQTHQPGHGLALGQFNVALVTGPGPLNQQHQQQVQCMPTQQKIQNQYQQLIEPVPLHPYVCASLNTHSGTPNNTISQERNQKMTGPFKNALSGLVEVPSVRDVVVGRGQCCIGLTACCCSLHRNPIHNHPPYFTLLLLHLTPFTLLVIVHRPDIPKPSWQLPYA
jgi:hypothetical protein